MEIKPTTNGLRTTNASNKAMKTAYDWIQDTMKDALDVVERLLDVVKAETHDTINGPNPNAVRDAEAFLKEQNTASTQAGGGCPPLPCSAVAHPIEGYHAWRDRLSADPTGWKFSEREEAIAFAAFVAGWWLRTCHNPDDHFTPPDDHFQDHAPAPNNP